jgi:hypothetical protein
MGQYKVQGRVRALHWVLIAVMGTFVYKPTLHGDRRERNATIAVLARRLSSDDFRFIGETHHRYSGSSGPTNALVANAPTSSVPT